MHVTLASASRVHRVLCVAQVNDAFLSRCSELEAALDVTSRRTSMQAASFDSDAANTEGENEPEERTDPVDPAVRAIEEQEARKRQEARTNEFYEAYKTLGRLQTFVWINTKGFQKIMKKCAPRARPSHTDRHRPRVPVTLAFRGARRC